MWKFLRPALLAALALPCCAEDAPPSPASAEASPCSLSEATGGDIRVVTCSLAAGHAYLLRVNFRGGHDDTSASLDARVEGRPVDCGASGKTTLFGEDGDVELHCRIGAASDPLARRRLVATVLWSHAQYRDFVLSAE